METANIEAYGAVASDPNVQPNVEIMTTNLNAIKQALVEKKHRDST